MLIKITNDKTVSETAAALQDFHVPGGRQNHACDIKTNRSSGDIQGAAIGGSGIGSGGHDCENHGRGGKLIGRP